MTPEEKAKELVNKMIGGCCRCPIDSKEAALTCCDEIIEELEPDDLFKRYNERATYWRDVKEEIIKL